jgi:hypothetical protein
MEKVRFSARIGHITPASLFHYVMSGGLNDRDTAMIRTAIPFGYLFIALFLVAGFVFGIICIIWGYRKHSRRAKWLGGGIVAIVIALGVAQDFYDRNLEWNPPIETDAEITGTWADSSETLTLSTNAIFTYHNAARTENGTWTRDDWNLHLHSTNFETSMRFVQYRSIYHLMRQPPDDPDMWDGNLGLSRK